MEKIHIKDDILYATNVKSISIFDINELLESKKFVLSPNFIGTINEDKSTNIDKLLSFSLISIEKSSFYNILHK